MIIIASIQHFCTWFTIDLLKTGSPTPVFEEMHKVDESDLHKYDMLHTHIGTVSSSEGIPEADKVKHMLPLHIRMISDSCNIVIPLRDPVEALITRQARHPDLGHMHLLEAFEFISTIDSVFFFPVDIKQKKCRKRNVARLFKFAELGMTGNTVAYTAQWEAPGYNKLNRKANTHADALKTAYEHRDWYYLKTYLGEELEYLKKRKTHLTKFMKSHGYTDLPWFTDNF